MKPFKTVWRSSPARVSRHALALFSIWTMLCGPLFTGARAQQNNAQPARLSEEQRILHVLNRLGFGARPGDVERVRAMGIEHYIKQQLDPERIEDAVAEAKVRDLTSLHFQRRSFMRSTRSRACCSGRWSGAASRPRTCGSQAREACEGRGYDAERGRSIYAG